MFELAKMSRTGGKEAHHRDNLQLNTTMGTYGGKAQGVARVRTNKIRDQFFNQTNGKAGMETPGKAQIVAWPMGGEQMGPNDWDQRNQMRWNILRETSQ